MDKAVKEIIHEIDSLTQAEKENLLAELREKVSELDAEIIELLGKRAYFSKLIGKLKAALSLPVYSSQREKELLNKLMEKLPSNLSQKSLIRIYERILDESRSIQRSEYKKKSD